MNVKIKKLHPNAVIPQYSKPGDAGQDLTAVSKVYDKDGNVTYGTGLAFAIPEGHVGMLFPRSSNAKKDLILSNSVGILDSGYRGEVFFKYKPSAYYAGEIGCIAEDTETFCDIQLPGLPDNDENIDESERYTGIDEYQIGDRIGQIIILPYPEVTFEEVEELDATERGTGGFGSTGI